MLANNIGHQHSNAKEIPLIHEIIKFACMCKCVYCQYKKVEHSMCFHYLIKEVIPLITQETVNLGESFGTNEKLE